MNVYATKIEKHQYVWGYIKLLKSLDIFLNLGPPGFRSTGTHGHRGNTVHFDLKKNSGFQVQKYKELHTFVPNVI